MTRYNNRGKSQAKTTKRSNDTDVNSLITSLVTRQVKEALTAGTTPQSPIPRKRRLSDRQEPDFNPQASVDAAETPPPPKKPSNGAKAAPTTTTTTTYASQVVILEGITNQIKNHPAKLSRAFNQAQPNVKIKGLRKTASGSILVIPQDPKDCCTLLKENAFPKNGPLGETVTARLPKSQTITHQVIIKQVDSEVTVAEMEEMLERQSLPYKEVRRIQSRAKGTPTDLVRLILTNEEDKKRLLKQGIYLDQMHFKCIQAKEDSTSFPKIRQCFNCQEVGGHLASECSKDLRCVLCAGPHRKAECKAPKEDYKCSNCNQNHASWSAECKFIQTARKSNEKPTMAQIASSTVTPSLLSTTVHSIVDSIKEAIALIVSEVVSRCLCELSLDILGNNVNKKDLPAKVEKIARNAANATNCHTRTLGDSTKQVKPDLVKQITLEKCFPNVQAPASNEKPTCSSSQPHHG